MARDGARHWHVTQGATALCVQQEKHNKICRLGYDTTPSHPPTSLSKHLQTDPRTAALTSHSNPPQFLHSPLHMPPHQPLLQIPFSSPHDPPLAPSLCPRSQLDPSPPNPLPIPVQRKKQLNIYMRLQHPLLLRRLHMRREIRF